MCRCGEGTPQLKCTTSSSDGQDERARHLFKPYSLGGQDVPVSLCKPTTHPNHEFEHDRDSRRSLGVESDQSISCEFSRTISVPLPPASLVDSWLKPPPSEAPERLTVRSPSPAPAASGSLANRSTATRVLAAAPAQAAAIILQVQLTRDIDHGIPFIPFSGHEILITGHTVACFPSRVRYRC